MLGHVAWGVKIIVPSALSVSLNNKGTFGNNLKKGRAKNGYCPGSRARSSPNPLLHTLTVRLALRRWRRVWGGLFCGFQRFSHVLRDPFPPVFVKRLTHFVKNSQNFSPAPLHWHVALLTCACVPPLTWSSMVTGRGGRFKYVKLYLEPMLGLYLSGHIHHRWPSMRHLFM